MRRADDQEKLAELGLPLPLEFASRLMGVICEAAEGYGYTDVSLSESAVVGTPPPPVAEVPEGHQCTPPGTGYEVTARRWRCPVCAARWVAAVEVTDWVEDE